jgi:hypothetical protein
VNIHRAEYSFQPWQGGRSDKTVMRKVWSRVLPEMRPVDRPEAENSHHYLIGARTNDERTSCARTRARLAVGGP